MATIKIEIPDDMLARVSACLNGSAVRGENESDADFIAAAMVAQIGGCLLTREQAVASNDAFDRAGEKARADAKAIVKVE